MMSKKNSPGTTARWLRYFLCAGFVLGCILVILGTRQAQAATAPKLSKSSITLCEGAADSLELKDATGDVIWASSDKGVVTVSATGAKCNITAVKSGTATVTAKCGTKAYDCIVTVTKQYLSASVETLYVGEEKNLTVMNTKGAVIWNSSDTGTLSITKISDTQIKMKALRAGTAIVRVENSGNTNECIVKVVKSHTHNYVEIGRTASTCMVKGSVTYQCSCQVKKQTILPLDSTNHKNTTTQIKNPTCTEAGSKKVICNDCNKTVQNTVLAALGHDDKVDPNSNGAVNICSRCNRKEYNYYKSNLIVDLDFTGMGGQKITTLKDKSHGYVFTGFDHCGFNNNGIYHDTTWDEYPYCSDSRLLDRIRNVMTTGEGITFEYFGNVITQVPAFQYGKYYYSPMRAGGAYALAVDRKIMTNIDVGIPFKTKTGSVIEDSGNSRTGYSILNNMNADGVMHIVTQIKKTGEILRYINGELVTSTKMSEDFVSFCFEDYPQKGSSFDRLAIFNYFQSDDSSRFISALRIYEGIIPADKISMNYSVEQAKMELVGISLIAESLEMEKGDYLDLYTQTVPANAYTEFTSSSNSSVVKVTSGTRIEAMNNGTAIVTVTAKSGNVTLTKKVCVTVKNLVYDTPDTRKYTGITIARKTDKLEVGDEFVCQAYALSAQTDEHPWKYYHFDENIVTYSSNNNDVCSAKNGVLVAKRSGKAIITAKAGNYSESFEVTVVEPTSLKYTAAEVWNPKVDFDTNDVEKCTKGLIDLLNRAKSAGYKKIIFPKLTYNVSPEYGTIPIPTQMIVDFNSSIIQIQPSAQSKKGYYMFRFQDTEYSEIRNATIYGERFLMEGTGSEGCVSVAFVGYNYRSGLRDCTISRSPGFNIIAHYGSGYVEPLKLTDLEEGGISSSGKDIDKKYTYRGKAYIKLPEKETFGFGNVCAYKGYWYLTARLYNIYFYDEYYNYITCYEDRHQYFDIKKPENAVYARITFEHVSMPTSCDFAWYGVAHIFNYDDPDWCYVTGCTIEDCYSTGMAPCAGTNWLIEKTTFRNNGYRCPASQIDWEDGWALCQGDILRDCRFEGGGQVTVLGCEGLAVHNNIFVNCGLQINAEARNTRNWLNQFVGDDSRTLIWPRTDTIFAQSIGIKGASCDLYDTDQVCMKYAIRTAGIQFERYADKTTHNKGHQFTMTGIKEGKRTYTCNTCGLTYYSSDATNGLTVSTYGEMDEDKESIEMEETEGAETVEEKAAMLADGMTIREALYQLSDADPSWDSVNTVSDTEESTIVSFVRSQVVPETEVEVIDIADDTSELPILVWLDGSVCYWYSEADEVRMNQDSDYMLSGLSCLGDISGLLDWNCRDVSDFDKIAWGCESPEVRIMLDQWRDQYQAVN